MGQNGFVDRGNASPPGPKFAQKSTPPVSTVAKFSWEPHKSILRAGEFPRLIPRFRSLSWLIRHPRSSRGLLWEVAGLHCVPAHREPLPGRGSVPYLQRFMQIEWWGRY